MITLSFFLSALCAVMPATDTLQGFATPCNTPNNENGYCVEIQRCLRFTYSDFSNPNSSNYDFVVASKCGPANENQAFPKVCCGKYPNFLNRISTTTQSPFTLPPPENSQPSPFPKVCGNQSIEFPSRIVGGREATLSDFPWMARLRRRSANGSYIYDCTGFLISEYFVLTAAHCIFSISSVRAGPLVDVQLGEHNTETNPDCERRDDQTWCADVPQFIKIGKPEVHPEYSNNKQVHNDIALIPLKEAAKFTKFVYPICLATELSQESEMWVAGWGRTKNQTFSTIKLKAMVRRASKNYCVPLYKNIGRIILYSQICAGGEAGVDSCSGDSGGPLMVQIGVNTWYAEGIVSFGVSCGKKNWPAIYTNIPYHIPWITRVMKDYVEKQVETVQITP